MGRFPTLVTHTLKLERERGNYRRVANILRALSDSHLQTVLPKEGIRLGKKALEIYEWLGDRVQQTESLIKLAFLLCADKRLDATESAVLLATRLLPEQGKQFRVCKGHRALDIFERLGAAEDAEGCRIILHRIEGE